MNVHIIKTGTGQVLGHFTPKGEYYGETYEGRPVEELMELSLMEGREATGLLWSAAKHVKHDAAAYRLLHELRNGLIDDKEAHGEESWADCNKTMFLYRRNNDPVYQAWLKEQEGR